MYRGTTYITHICISIIIFMMSVLCACNTHVNITLNQSPSDELVSLKPVGGEFDVEVTIAPFFIQYLEDLLAIEGIQGLIDLLQLQEFLTIQDNITSVSVMAISQTNQETLRIVFHSNDIVATCNSLQLSCNVLPQSNNDMQVFSLPFTRSSMKALFNSFSEIKSMNIAEVFFPDAELITQSQFAKYIAWSFSEYQQESVIIDKIEQSEIAVVLNKGKNNSHHVLDSDWVDVSKQYSDSTALYHIQAKTFFLVPTLYNQSTVLMEFSF